jgi:N-acetylneuraminic acid mutarotase
MIGGSAGAGGISNIYSAPINADGTLGTWSFVGNLPLGLHNSQVIVTINRVYIIGGFTNSSTGVYGSYTAPINADGTLGAWTSGPSAPIPTYYGKAVVTKNRVYILGGGGNTQMLTAPINSDGTLGSFYTSGFTPTREGGEYIVTRNRIYVFGGYGGSETFTTGSHSAPINADGTIGTWVVNTGFGDNGLLDIAPANRAAIITNGKVYLLGGNNGVTTEGSNEVQFASISGGLNDYSPYYETTLAPTNPSMFKLPDTTLTDSYSLSTYIKI